MFIVIQLLKYRSSGCHLSPVYRRALSERQEARFCSHEGHVMVRGQRSHWPSVSLVTAEHKSVNVLRGGPVCKTSVRSAGNASRFGFCGIWWCKWISNESYKSYCKAMKWGFTVYLKNSVKAVQIILSLFSCISMALWEKSFKGNTFKHRQKTV